MFLHKVLFGLGLIGFTLCINAMENTHSHIREFSLQYKGAERLYRVMEIQELTDERTAFVKSFSTDYEIYLKDIFKKHNEKQELTEAEEIFLLKSSYKDAINIKTEQVDRQKLEKILDGAFEDEEKDLENRKKDVSFYRIEIEGKLAAYFSAEPYKDGIYVRQFFTVQSFKRQGVGHHVLDKILPSLFPDIKKFYAATRKINKGGLALWKDTCGFKESEAGFVNKEELIHGLPRHSYVFLEK